MYTREMKTQSKTETYVLTFKYHYSLITKSRNHSNVPQHVDKWSTVWSYNEILLNNIKEQSWTSLVVQWIRIHLPMQEAQDQSLVQEDSTCQEQLRPCGTTTEVCTPRACDLQQEKPLQWMALFSPKLEKARSQQGTPGASKINK